MIDSASMTLPEVLMLGPYEPAKVQRQYQWQSLQVSDLLDDLFGAFQSMGIDPGDESTAIETEPDAAESVNSAQAINRTPKQKPPPSALVRRTTPRRMAPDIYFLGATIFYKSPLGKTLVVFDGLQRLTTISIMLAALRDSWPAMPRDAAGKLQSWLFDGDKPRLTLQTTGGTFAAIMNAQALRTGRLTEGEVKMRSALRLFDQKFHGWSSLRRAKFVEFLETRVYLTVTEVDNPTVAYQMFNGANARGLRLNPSDVLKGFFSEQIRDAGGTVKQVENFTDVWRDAEMSLRNGFGPFLHALEVYKFRPKEPHTTGELLDTLFVATDASQPLVAQTILAWFEGEFTSLVKVAARARAHTQLGTLRGVDIAFRQLSFLSWNDWLPFCLAAGDADGPAPAAAEFAAEIDELCRACYMIELLDWREGSRRKKIVEAIEQREAGLDPFNFNGRVAGTLCFKSKRVKRIARERLRQPLLSEEKRGALVRWLETLQWGSALPGKVTDEASIEHILPITARDDWLTLFTDPERDIWTNRLGNLCQIDRAVNEQIGNSQWPVKRDAYAALKKPSKGADLALSISKAAVASGEAAWSPATVKNRDDQMVEFAVRALDL